MLQQIDFVEKLAYTSLYLDLTILFALLLFMHRKDALGFSFKTKLKNL